SRRRQAVGSTRWFGSIMFSHEATKITKLILFSDREAFLRDFASLCEKNFGIWFYLFRTLSFTGQNERSSFWYGANFCSVFMVSL
ncbi:MAG: hypothetical protein WC440_05620, partial [Candidatus Omnitrophota bacterium]